jgi:hypothetical protein
VSTHTLRPWTDLVKLHPDVEASRILWLHFCVECPRWHPRDQRVYIDQHLADGEMPLF